MPGLLPHGFRQAYLQEELGVLLLRGVAAVVPVPRPDDVGIDVIATLLRPGASRNLLAENSFFVQIKSGSVERVRYAGTGFEWLRALELPFFIARVNLTDCSLSLYSTHRVFERIAAIGLDAVTLVLGRRANRQEGEVDLGEPVLKLTTSGLGDPGSKNHAYELLKTWLCFAKEDLRRRGIGWFREYIWTCGQPPKVQQHQLVGSSTPEGLRPILDDALSPLCAWAILESSGDQKGSRPLILKLLTVLRDRGVSDTSSEWVVEICFLESREAYGGINVEFCSRCRKCLSMGEAAYSWARSGGPLRVDQGTVAAESDEDIVWTCSTCADVEARSSVGR